MRYCQETCAIELSVEELCELAYRCPDLGRSSRVKVGAPRDGALLQKIWQQAGGVYLSAVSLSNTVKHGDLYYTVSGSADGLIRYADGGAEIDTVCCVRSYDFSAPPGTAVMARLWCYAYFFAVRDELCEIAGRVTVCNIDNGKLRTIRYRFTTEQLRRRYTEMISRISWRAKDEADRRIRRLPSASSARFPYAELREGQELMIRECYGAIKHGKRIFVEAPTGTGKTVSALYPAVRALGEGYVDKIFYLTAKASTRKEAYLAAGKLFEGGADLRCAVITAKEQVCPDACERMGQGKHRCEPSECQRAQGYYDRAERALCELLETAHGYPRSLICQIAKKYQVCPYELSLDLSELCDIVICDYNYAFDPSAYFRRYFSDDGQREKYVFLIDEAHNLADRARDMYSASLRCSELEQMAQLTKAVNEKLFSAAESARRTLIRLKRLCRDDLVRDADGEERGFYMSRTPAEELNRELERLEKVADGWLKKNREHPIAAELTGLLSDVRRYLSVSEYFDSGFLFYVEVSGGDITVKIYCLDPSPTMDALLNRAVSSVLFSATLTPAEYFCDVLGGAKQASSIALPSPFDPDGLCVAVADYLSVRMEDREKNSARYATVIAATVSAKAGNYIAYFPSYSCLESVRKIFQKKYPKVEVVVQRRGMGATEKEEFLNAFKDDAGHLRVGFCVLSGAFSEGVDLPGSRLIGAIVFGVGLPSLSNERNMIQEYFDGTVGQGYEYAYTYPGMNHVLQAVGRVIRREEDRGVAVLVDDRYLEPKYRALYPAHWQNVQYAGNAASLAEIMRRFWEKRQ